MLNYAKKRKFLEEIAHKNNFDVFVETGTFLGDTVEHMKSHFKEIHSIELQGDLAKDASKRFENLPHITIHEGDSSEILKNLKFYGKKVFYWLDGHYSNEFHIGDKYVVTAQAEKDTPILEELEAINSDGCTNRIILIDDARLFVGKNDYPTINQLKKHAEKLFGQEIKLIRKHDILQIHQNI